MILVTGGRKGSGANSHSCSSYGARVGIDLNTDPLARTSALVASMLSRSSQLR